MQASHSLNEIHRRESKDRVNLSEAENFDTVESIGSKRIFNVVNVFYIDRLKLQKFAVPPFFKEHLQNVEYEEGDVLRLRCKARGYPLPEVEWYKEGERIAEVNETDEDLGALIGYKYYATNQNGDLSLVVTNVMEDDFGQFTCKIRNAVGEAGSTALVFPKSKLEDTLPQKGGGGEKQKVIVEERITVVERKPLFSDARSDFPSEFDSTTKETAQINKDNGIDINSNEQLMTVLFAVPKSCETKKLEVKIFKGQTEELLSDDEFQLKNRFDSSRLILYKDGGTTRAETSPSSESDSFEGELRFSPSSEGEIHNRISWIQSGELSDSEYRRNSIPQPLPIFFAENADNSMQPNSNQITVAGTETHLAKESERRMEEDEDVSESESKDTVRGDCGRLFSRDGVFTFTENPECAEDHSEFADVFDDDPGTSPKTELLHDIFSDNGVATLQELSPFSPDSDDTLSRDFEQRGASDYQIREHEESPENVPTPLVLEKLVKPSYTASQQSAFCAAKTEVHDSTDVQENKDLVGRVSVGARASHVQRSSLLSGRHTSDEDNLKALDELIARLLEFSQRDYVLVSSLKLGRDRKGTTSRHGRNTSDQHPERIGAPGTAAAFEVNSETYKIQRMDIPLHPSDLSAKSEDEVAARIPKFLIPLEDMVIDPDESVVLNISVTGFPAPQISWFKNNLPLNEASTGEITDDLKCQSAIYTCIAKNSSGEAVTSAVITVRQPDVEVGEATNNVSAPTKNIVKMRKKKGVASGETRWSQIISASLVDYLRSKAKSLKQAEDQAVSRVPAQTGVMRDDITLRRGSMLSLNSLSTTSFESADETLTSSDAVWEEVESTCDEDFMSTDEFFFSGINEGNLGKLNIPDQFGDTEDSEDDLFYPRPLTPTPISEKPPFEYEVVGDTSRRPFTRIPTDPCIVVERDSSKDMGTAPCNRATPVPDGEDDCQRAVPDEKLKQPKFLMPLKDGEFVIGSKILLTCCVLGSSAAAVTWHRNGIQILPPAGSGDGAAAKSFMQSMNPKEGVDTTRTGRLHLKSEEKKDDGNALRYTQHTLTIQNCRQSDAGEYSVTAKNTYGSVMTKASIRFVEEGQTVSGEPAEFAAPQFLAKTVDSDGMVGGEAVMNFEIVGQPEPDITILHNREEVDGDRYSLKKENDGKYTFTINDLRLEDEGEVRISAMNVVGYIECVSELFVDERSVTPTPDRSGLHQWSSNLDEPDFGALDIREQLASQSIAPYFDDIVDDVIALPGSDATFTVRVYSWPAPDVFWYKNEEQILNEGRFSIETVDFGTHMLKIKAINEADAGIYTCVAKNSVGQASCKAELLLGPNENLSDKSSEEEEMKENQRRRLKDNFTVCSNIRSGSFSTVRLVKHNETSEEYAAKYIRCIKSEFKERFLSEVKILKKLSHEVIVACKDFYESKKSIILVLEHAGQEWFEFLLEKQDVNEFEISSQVRSLCDGLQYLHENKVVHLDLKPENIMIKESRMKLIDFGSAKELKHGEDIFWEYGNPEFAPPEVIQSKPVTTASDMWSLGVVVFVAVSGNAPFLGDSDYATVVQVCEGKFEFDNRWFGSVSGAARNFIENLLVVKSSSRLSSEQAALHEWLHDNNPGKSATLLSEGRLKYFCSRRKWQRSLVGPKTSLTVRSLPSLLKREYDSTSVAVPRSLMSNYTSSSTVTESDDDSDFVTAGSAPTSPRTRLGPFRNFSHNTSLTDRAQRRSKSSITIEDTIEMQKVFAPTVKVTESSPKASPLMSRKESRSSPTEDDCGVKNPSVGSAKKPKPVLKPLRLSPGYPREKLKLLGKKVSFDDDPPNVTAVEAVQSPVFLTASEKLTTPPIITEEIQLKDLPPVAQMPEVPAPQTSSGPPGVTLDRPQSVSKLLKEDRKVLKTRKTVDADSHRNARGKIRTKLSLKSLRRHRSLDARSVSSSSDDEMTTRSERIKKPNSGGKSKFSLFSRRKRQISKGSSLDSTAGPPDEKKQDTTLDTTKESIVKPAVKTPIKGILKKGPSGHGSSQSDPHLPKSLQKPLSPASAAAANLESFPGSKFSNNPLKKGISIELGRVIEKSGSASRQSSTSGRRRPQFRRGSSVESALLAKPRERVSGLRGPLLERGAQDDEPMAGMSLRRSTPVLTKGYSLPSHSRSYSGPLSLPSPSFRTGMISPPVLSPRVLPSSPHRKYFSLERSFFSQSVDIAGAQLPETVPEYGLNVREHQAQAAMLSSKGLHLPRSRSQDRPIGRRGRSADRKGPGESYAPYIKVPLIGQGMTHNQTYATLSCIIDAFPQPEVSWLKDGEKVTASDRTEILSEPSISRYQLKIRSVILPDDFGHYTCEAKNTIGTVKTDCKLVQAVPPEKPSAPEFSGTDGTNVWISWNPPTNCAPSPISYMLQYREMAAMRWVVVDDCIKDTLHKIENLRQTTSYRFRVRAVNNAGISPFSKVSQRIQLDPKATVQSLKYAF